MYVGKDEQDEECLEKYEELKDPPEGWREKSGVCNGHLEEEGMKEAIANIDERVLVDVGVPHAVVVIVEWNIVVVGGVVRHGLSHTLDWDLGGIEVTVSSGHSANACALLLGQHCCTEGCMNSQYPLHF